jgi:hypothetical protein
MAAFKLPYVAVRVSSQQSRKSLRNLHPHHNVTWLTFAYCT